MFRKKEKRHSILANAVIQAETVEESLKQFDIYTPEELQRMEREELAARARAMTPDEIEIFLDNIPIEMCTARIQKELDRVKTYEEMFKDAMNMMVTR